VIRGEVVGMRTDPESLLALAIVDAEEADRWETLDVRLREVETISAPRRDERSVGTLLFLGLLVTLWVVFGRAFLL
jgi:hypothetical protein